MSLQYICITQQGSSHIHKGIPCQDASGGRAIRMEKAGHDALIAAVADGVGSCEFSQFGSQIAVNSVLQYLEENLTGLEKADDQSVAPVLKAAYQFALDKIEEDADANKRPFVQMDTTLTTAVYLDDGTLWCGHIGDGGIVALYDDATYEMITERLKGESAESVIPLRVRDAWTFGRALKPVASLALMTDGVLDVAVASARYNERVYFPMIGAALANPMKTGEDAEACRRMMEEFLSSADFRRSVNDDITFAALQNSDMVAALPEIRFDEQEWMQEQKRIREEIEENLKKAAQETLESIAGKREHREEPAPEVRKADDKQELSEKWKQVGEDGKALLESTGSALNASIRRVVSDVRLIVQKKSPKTDENEPAVTVEDEPAAPAEVEPVAPAEMEPAAPAEAEAEDLAEIEPPPSEASTDSDAGEAVKDVP